MHNLKELRNNLDEFKKKLKNRNVDFDLNDFKKKDSLNRDLIKKKKILNKKKNLYLNQKINLILKNPKKFQKKF